MAMTKRVQVLMEPEEFEAVAKVAGEAGESVAEWIRQAARRQLRVTSLAENRSAAARRFLNLPDLALPSWPELKAELEEHRLDALP